MTRAARWPRRLRKLRVRKGMLLRCPECGAARARRQLWRHFRLTHPDLHFSPIGRYDGGKMYWAVGDRGSAMAPNR